MHTPPVDRARRAETARRKPTLSGSDGALFARHLAGPAGDAAIDGESALAGGATSAAAADAASALDALLGVQEVTSGSEPGARRATARYASDLLDQLEALRRDVLDGRVPAARLTELARALREDRQRSRDPGLDDLVEQVELRAEVELAKLQSR